MNAVVKEKTVIPASVALGVRVEGIDLAAAHGAAVEPGLQVVA